MGEQLVEMYCEKYLEEVRLLDYYGWHSRQEFGYAGTPMENEWLCIEEIDTLIGEADDLLEGHADISGISYQSQKDRIDELHNCYYAYIDYIDALYRDVYDVDHAFYVDIKKHAVEQLSNVRQEKYEVQEGELAGKYGSITLKDFVAGSRIYQGR